MGTKALDHISLEKWSTGHPHFPFPCVFKARFFREKCVKILCTLKAYNPWTTVLTQKTICLFPCKHWARLLRTLGITSTEHTFTKGTWFSSDMPVSFLSIAHTINPLQTKLNPHCKSQLAKLFWGVFKLCASFSKNLNISRTKLQKVVR
jgi:hypothetical protein